MNDATRWNARKLKFLKPLHETCARKKMKTCTVHDWESANTITENEKTLERNWHPNRTPVTEYRTMAMSKTSGLFNYNFKRFKCFSFSICIAIPSLSSSAASLFMLRNILNNSSFLSLSISELRLLISFLPFTTFMRIYPNEFVFDESKIGKNNKSFFPHSQFMLVSFWHAKSAQTQSTGDCSLSHAPFSYYFFLALKTIFKSRRIRLQPWIVDGKIVFWKGFYP